MSSSLKFSLLALATTAVAIPHYGHMKYHKPSGYQPGTGAPYPTGGWAGANSTVITPTGTAALPEEKTTTIEEFETSTTTLTSTIYVKASRPPTYEASYVYPEDVSSVVAIPSQEGNCGGPETVYITATNEVTVTVTAGKKSSAFTPAPSPSSAAEVTSQPPVAPTGGYEAPIESESFVLPSSTAEDKVTVSIPQKGIETPAPPKDAAPPQEEAPAPKPSATEAEKENTSAAPSATPKSSPSYSGGKRGLAYNDASLCSAFEGKASWAYSWGSAPGGDLPSGMSFVPMAWVKNEDPKAWLQKVDEAVASGSKAVMGFNEPDHPAQANMDPATACKHWREYMNPIASAHPDVTIIGPSVTNAGDKPNWGLDWYKSFMEVCPDAIWHKANLHFYDIYMEGEGDMGTVNRFKKHIEAGYKLTGRKVWVTEFGLNPGSSAEDTGKFLREVMKWMDESDKVEGYSYFMVGTGENQLSSGNGLSQIGQIYAAN